ncbi:MAG: hypothetical protein U0269_35925 [Polyangiales bacterium]
MLRVAVASLSGMIGLAAAVPASAQPAAPEGDPSQQLVLREDSLVQQAIERRRLGQHEEAVVLLRQAYELRRSARAAGQLALAEQAIGRWAHAERRFREALAATDDAWVERNRATLERSLASATQRLATVDVVGGDDGAELWVDGERVGQLPADRTLRVVVGAVRIEHRPRVGAAITRVIELSPGGRERVYFAPSAARPEQGAGTEPDRRAAPVQARPSASARGAPVASREPFRPHPTLWIGVAVTAVGAVGVLAPWAAAQSIVGGYDAECFNAASPNRAQCAARREDGQRVLDSLSTATYVGWAVFSAGVVTSGVGVGLSFWGRGAAVHGRF